MTTWIDCTFDCANAEDDGVRLFELGVGGVEIVSDTRIRCVLESEEKLQEILSLGWKLVSRNETKQSEWIAKCDELFTPLAIDNFQVIPVRSLEEGRARGATSNELLLIPGLGFGTGHHTATRLCAEMLQRASKQQKRILDLGTGSGLLAILAARLFSAPIEAIDIDQMALDNAQENVEMNKLTERVTILLGGIEKLSGEYSLIVANLYAELLCQFEPQLRAHLISGGTLIVSGIMGELAGEIKKHFCLPHWSQLEEHQVNGWAGFMLSRK